MLLNDKVYKILKWFAQYLGTISALTIFLGVILGISTSAYNKTGGGTDGVMNVDTSNPAKDVYNLQLNGAVEDLANKSQVTFKVNKV